MSFILDALKKSETDRQQQGSAEFSTVPSGSEEPRPMRWLWLLAALLAINVAVLIGVLMRPATPEPAAADSAAAPATVTTADPPPAADGFAQQVATRMEERSAAGPAEVSAPPNPGSQTVAATVVDRPAPGSVPSIDQLRLNGSLQIADLHLDIHVYSDAPADRFVFINMVKHREQSRIAEGPLVREITPDGVILEYQGQAFLLPRE